MNIFRTKYEVLLFAFVTFIAIFLWVSSAELHPDTCTYLNVAQNIVERGEIFQWNNWPSTDLHPGKIPFTDFSPGLSFLSVPFVALIREPVRSALIMQICIILLFNFTVFSVLSKLFDNRKTVIIGFLLFCASPFIIKSEMHFLTEIPFLTCIIASLGILVSKKAEFGGRQFFLLCIYLFIGSSLKYTGIFSVIALFAAYLTYRFSFKKLLISSFFACLAPGLWYIRNTALYGYFSSSHFSNTGVNSAEGLINKLQTSGTWTFPLAVLAIALTVLFVSLPYMKYLKLSPEKLKSYNILIATFGVHLIGIIVISIFARMDDLGMRLLTPAFGVFILITVFIFSSFAEVFSLGGKVLTSISVAITIGFIAIGALFFKTSKASIGKSIYPKEKYLWERELSDYLKSRGSTHFYSMFNLKHQLYCKIYQRVFFNEKSLNEMELIEALQMSGNPFFVLDNEDLLRPEFGAFERLEAGGLIKKASFDTGSFTVFEAVINSNDKIQLAD